MYRTTEGFTESGEKQRRGYSGQAPFSEFWSAKRRAEFRKKGFGTMNINSRLMAENAVSSEIDRIIADRLTGGERVNSGSKFPTGI
jgi:hypothetical protein